MPSEGILQVPIRNYSSSMHWIDFVGIVGNPDTTVIAIADVSLKNKRCDAPSSITCADAEFPCKNSFECIDGPGECERISGCMESSDEMSLQCGMYMSC